MWDLSSEWSLAESAAGRESSQSFQRKAFLLVFWLVNARWKLPGFTTFPVSQVRADKVGGGDGLPVLLNHLPDAGPGDLPPHYQGLFTRHTITLFPPEFLREPDMISSLAMATHWGGGEELHAEDAGGALGLRHPNSQY